MVEKSSIPDEVIQGVLRATQAAAVAAARLAGRGDEKQADYVAVEAMRRIFHRVPIKGEVVIGEGERDEAPMLFIGEKIGSGKGVGVDIAVDPLEGTTLTAKAMADALSVAALGLKGSLLNAPDVYMEKIAAGPGLPENLVGLDRDPADIVKEVAKAKRVSPKAITVCVLDRPRHAELIEALRSSGAGVALISDGDVAGAMHTANPDSAIDLYMGIGGAPEGVLAAAALANLGGQMEARLVLDNVGKRARAKRMKIKDPDRIFTLADLVSGPVVFAASGVTGGSLLPKLRFLAGGEVEVCSLLLTPDGQQHIRARLPEKVLLG